MAFVISRGGSSFSENEKTSLDKDSATVGPVSNQLYLKSCSKASSQSLDKHLVLQRIRHRRSLNKVKSAFDNLLGTSQPATASSQLHTKWLEQDDAFSAP